MTVTATLVLGSPHDDALMATLVRRIEAAGIAVLTVGLDASVANDAVHQARFRAALADVVTPAIIGGFSLGARIAATLCPAMV